MHFLRIKDLGRRVVSRLPPVRVLRKRSRQNHPALDSTRLRDFLRQLNAAESLNVDARIAMRLVVLTACRKDEVVGARWCEFNLATAAWETPADRMKARRAHWVSLSRLNHYRFYVL